MKKIVLIAAAGLITTASIVAATVSTGKKTEKKAVKSEVVKEKKECNRAKKSNCMFSF